MLLVKTKIKESKIHGIGLFADQFINKGTEIWKFVPKFGLKFTKEEILNFPDFIQIYLSKYAWKSKKSGLYCFATDDGKFINHSDNPNVLSEYRENEEEIVTIALNDIKIGEEIFDNYNSFEDFFMDEDNVLKYIGEKFNLEDELDPRVKNI